MVFLLIPCVAGALLTACTQTARVEDASANIQQEQDVSETRDIVAGTQEESNTDVQGGVEDTLMKKVINYTDDGRVNMEVYVHTNPAEPLPAIISLPGGAFGFLVGTDQEPTAMTFYERGFNAFVLNYSVGEYSGFPAPLDEVSWAIWQIRTHAEEWNVDPDKVIVMGFSAGVSVAGMSATQWNAPGLYERVGAPDAESIRPNAAVMGYGACDTSHTIVDNPDVVNPGVWGKIVTDKTPELDYLYYVDENTAPMFIWQPHRDPYVPKENQTMLAEALENAGVEYELHMFKDGYHGMSVGYNAPGYDLSRSPQPDADRWVGLCIDWLDNLFNGDNET